jgi:hypothetical protein
MLPALKLSAKLGSFSSYKQVGEHIMISLIASACVLGAGCTPAAPVYSSWEERVEQTAFPARDSARTFRHDGWLWISNGYVKSGVHLGDLWRSQDGHDWQIVSDNTPYDLYSATATFKGHIYAANQGVWRSQDGLTWETVTRTAPFATGQEIAAQAHLEVWNDRLWFMNQFAVWSSADGETWRKEPTPDWLPRAAYTSAVHDGRLFVMAGATFDQPADPPEKGYPDRITQSDVWVTDDGRTWEQVTDAAPFGQRAWTSAISCAGRLYLFGGYDGASDINLGDTWVSDDGLSWVEIRAEGPSARHFPSLFCTQEGVLLAAGNAWPVQNDVWLLKE